MSEAHSAPVSVQDLGALAATVLGDLAFMVADIEKHELPVGTVWLRGEVRYIGPVQGRLCCWCTREFATRLAANLLGIEPGSSDAQVRADDALRELLNVLCGQLVTSWYGAGPVFNLTIPVVEESLTPPASAGTPQTCCFTVEDEPFVLAHVAGA